MKKLFTIILATALAFSAASAQVTRNGNTFKAEQTAGSSTASSATKTEYTYEDTDGKAYSIWLSKNGRAYILRTSRNGNEYKKYLGEDISRTICKELNREYKESTK